MRAVVASAPGRQAVEHIPDPDPAANEVVIEVRACGICGTDLHLLSGGLGDGRFPLVPGHESWGEVVAVGTGVHDHRVGDLVAVDPSLHCGRCGRCLRGQGNMCEDWGAIGATRPGAWAEYVAVPEANCHRLGESFPWEAAALLEPVACAVRGLDRLRPRADEPAVVCGAGTMGLILALLLDARGVGPVTVVDPNPARRELAARLTDATARHPDEVTGLRVPWVVEATGHPSGFTQALDLVDRAGHLLVFGVAPPAARVEVSPYRVYADELTIVGSMAILHSFPAAVDTVRRHAARLTPLVTAAFGLGDIGTALDGVRAGTTVKTLIVPGASQGAGR
ncbi:alcohol dehydrogenase catalytic domain-containing protein [Streptomyces sp. NPDC056716]|uniref:alcohol dehydrogenase catalytic domain-containing protein n=1 Tax=unclassified Streptomyces TaxID=2593676 RepID=UPI0036A63308